MITEAMSAPTGAPQPLLFDSLPETPSRRPSRRARPAAAVAEGLAADTLREPVSAPMPPPMAPSMAVPPPPRVIVEREPFDPAALTNPELRALVQALPDARLSHLIVEAAREIRRRLAPDDVDDGELAHDPNPALLRAARLAAGELTGDDG